MDHPQSILSEYQGCFGPKGREKQVAYYTKDRTKDSHYTFEISSV